MQISLDTHITFNIECFLWLTRPCGWPEIIVYSWKYSLLGQEIKQCDNTSVEIPVNKFVFVLELVW